jgi:hypothetical protein
MGTSRARRASSAALSGPNRPAAQAVLAIEEQRIMDEETMVEMVWRAADEAPEIVKTLAPDLAPRLGRSLYAAMVTSEGLFALKFRSGWQRPPLEYWMKLPEPPQ